MLDYNHSVSFAEGINVLIDDTLAAENTAQTPRDYLGGSRLGVPCERALQYEYAQAPKDDGAEFDGRTLRIIAAGPDGLLLGTPALWECKSLNAKSWKDTAKRGVAVSKPVYAAQIAVYQAYMEASVPRISANPALFTAISKDTAELHHELVPFDGALAQTASDKGVRIIKATEAGELLPRIAQSADFYECRFCPWADRCWRAGP